MLLPLRNNLSSVPLILYPEVVNLDSMMCDTSESGSGILNGINAKAEICDTQTTPSGIRVGAKRKSTINNTN